MADAFAAAVKGWSTKTEIKQTAVLHESIRGLADTLGDKTPKVTGNLANSRQVTTGGPPTIEWKKKKFREPSDEINNAVAGVEVGETAWIGFRAPYAHKVEEKHAMTRLSAQLWKQIANAAARKVKG